MYKRDVVQRIHPSLGSSCWYSAPHSTAKPLRYTPLLRLIIANAASWDTVFAELFSLGSVSASQDIHLKILTRHQPEKGEGGPQTLHCLYIALLSPWPFASPFRRLPHCSSLLLFS